MEPKEPKSGDISQSLVLFEMLNVSTRQEQYFNVSSWYSSAIEKTLITETLYP